MMQCGHTSAGPTARSSTPGIVPAASRNVFPPSRLSKISPAVVPAKTRAGSLGANRTALTRPRTTGSAAIAAR